MRTILLAIAIFTVAEPAFAINRYNIQSMSCSKVQAIIQREGAAILRYPSKRVAGMTLYDRYVRNGLFCDPGQHAERAFVPTRDNPSCWVWNCKQNDFDNFYWRRHR